MGPRAGLDALEKRKVLPYRHANPGRPAHSPSLYRLPETLVPPYKTTS
jgi:hypothetical protein